MALAANSDLTKESFIITKEQARRLRALRDLRKTPSNRINLSDIAREVIEAGLNEVTLVSVTVSTPNGKEQAA